MDSFFHLFSNGDDAKDFILSDEDRIAAVNRLAVVGELSGVRIVAFDIEDTHLHSLLSGAAEKCEQFKLLFQRRTRYYISLTRANSLDARFTLSMTPVTDFDYLKTVSVYIICQATKDGKKVMPYDYRWSSAALYFRTGLNDLLWRQDEKGRFKTVRMVADISGKEYFKIFRTLERMPGNWEVCDNMVLPSSFVDVATFQSIFLTHNAFRTFCGAGRKADQIVLDSMSQSRGVALEESEARDITSRTCYGLFGFSDVRRLSVQQRICLARRMRADFGMGFSQLSRRVHLPESELRKYIK